MSNEKKKLNRREALSLGAKGFFGANLGMGLVNMAGAMLPDQGPFARIKKILKSGDQEAFAQAIAPTGPTTMQLTYIDKWQQALVLFTGGDLSVIPGLPAEATSSVNVGGIAMTALAAVPKLVDMVGQNRVRMTFFPQTTSNSGGHSLQNTYASQASGAGFNYMVEANKIAAGGSTGVLGFVGFNVGADANTSLDAAKGVGGVPMQTYSDVSSVRSILKRSIAAIAAPGSDFFDFRASLDKLATKNDETIKNLQIIRETVQPALDPLLQAAAAPNYVQAQAETLIVLSQNGLAKNGMFAATHDDTNGGNQLTNTGGQYNWSPVQSVPAVMEAVATVAEQLDDFIIISCSDGGRSANNGDSAGTVEFIASSPNYNFLHGVIGSVMPTAGLGNTGFMNNNGSDIKLSDGSTTRVLTFQNLFSLVLKVGHGVPDSELEYPYPVDAVQG